MRKRNYLIILSIVLAMFLMPMWLTGAVTIVCTLVVGGVILWTNNVACKGMGWTK